LSAYECGFDPFNYKDIQTILNIRFYLVGILFIIFDIEIIFLFPWVLTLSSLGFFGYWTMITFLFLLTVGFIYEWKKGALEWD
jgi:NADH-quinone oxidoreductase subunit A